LRRGFQAKPGDQVTAIDGEKIASEDIQDIMKRVSLPDFVCFKSRYPLAPLTDICGLQLKGPVGSEVTISFMREGQAEDLQFHVVVTRTQSEFQDIQVIPHCLYSTREVRAC